MKDGWRVVKTQDMNFCLVKCTKSDDFPYCVEKYERMKDR